MADKKNEKPEQGEAEAPKKSKKGLFLGGGMLGLIAAGWAVSLVATPSVKEERLFAGPFVISLSPEDVQVNLSGDGGKRFLVMTLKAEIDAYEEGYAAQRIADPLYDARLKDALIRVGRQKTKDDLADTVGEELFKEEVCEAIDPILFPIHVGNPLDWNGRHEKSGLGPGRSIEDSTLRSGFFAHELHLDAAERKIRLDEGPETTFEGGEEDLELFNEHGDVLFVDVSHVVPEFKGKVNAGVFGRIRNVYFGKLLVQ